MPGVAVSAASTSSSIANANACRVSDRSIGERRSFAETRSLTGTTAQRSISEASGGRFQHRSRQRLAVFERQHQGPRKRYRQAQLAEVVGVRLVGDIKVEDVAVMPRDGSRADRQAELGH